MIEIAKTKAEGVTLYDVSASALRWVYPVSLFLWLGALAMPYIGLHFSPVCQTLHQPFAHYDFWKCWGVFFVIWCVAMLAEFKALKLVIIPYSQTFVRPSDGRYFEGVFGRKMRCKGYLLLIGLVTAVSKLDLPSNGLMVAKVWRTNQCAGEESHAAKIWREVISTSIVQSIPHSDNLEYSIWFVWGLMFLQAFGSLLTGVPCWCYDYAGQPISYEYLKACNGSGYYTFTLWLNKLRRWICCMDPLHQDALARHADCLMTVAFNSRMVSLVDKNLQYILIRARKHFDDKKYHRAIFVLSKAFSRATHKIWLFTLIERGLMLEANLTLFALSRHLLKQHNQSLLASIDGQMLLAVMVSFGMCLKSCWDHYTEYKALSKCMADFTVPDLDSEPQGTLNWLKCRKIAFLTGAVLLGIILCHCFAKLIAAFRCESCMWNLPFYPNVSWLGCVSNSSLNA